MARRAPAARAPRDGATTALQSRVLRRIDLILQHEPSWFAEVGSAVAILAWSVLALLTNDYQVYGWAFAAPCIGIASGPLRVWLLFQLSPVPRVMAACCAFAWWAWIALCMARALGAAPSEGAFLGFALVDILTVLKFSFIAWRLSHGRGD